MAAFIKLDDSPIFLKQVYSLEQITDELEDRCQRLYNGCKKFMAAFGEACNGDMSFADSLGAFGGGHDDPLSVSIGGPVMSKFITAIRELATYKELLRSQVEHVLTDRLMHFINVDLLGAKESRRRFDNAIYAYDQAREKFVSLKKNTREDIIAELEEDLQNSKSAFEKTRFNLVNALTDIEAKKKYEFLESISAIMDAHLRYFKLGYDLMSQMEPFIHQVLTYAQQVKEQDNFEQDKLAKRIQEFRTQAEFHSLQASSCIEPSSAADSIRGLDICSYKNMETVTHSNVKEEVQTIKQGYLLKRSSRTRGDWKRRFFVLDNHGALYYYKMKGSKPMGAQSHHFTHSVDHNSSVFGRFRSRHKRASSLSEDILSFHTLDLCTSTIKLDAEDTDLRLCFRIISPLKTYTLQAENESDMMEWVRKVKGAIASVFSSHFLHQPHIQMKHLENDNGRADSTNLRTLDDNGSAEDDNKPDCVSKILREIPGNELCAECSASEPDWASLNLGILLCIECSGVHRNLGVHISKVRSLTYDVKVWEPTILDLFRNLGNTYCNSLWEGLLLSDIERVGEPKVVSTSIMKPKSKDAIYAKEKYIQAKYVEKSLVIKDESASESSYATRIWQAVEKNSLQEVYGLIVLSSANIISTIFDDVVCVDLYSHPAAQSLRMEREEYDPITCERIEDSNEPGNCLQGCSLLHLACGNGNQLMIELLLQFGADINMCDFHGRTPLHHCIARGNNRLAKLLLRRGAIPSIKDGGGLSALERAMELGAIADEELFVLLAES